jgi:alpha-tubulin suppressor-like RCC1 family protein
MLLQEEAAKYTDTNFPGQPPPKMVKIFLGNYHSVAISDDGKYVMTWGRGELGQLGHQYDRPPNICNAIRCHFDLGNRYSKSTSVPTVVKHLVGSEKHRPSVSYVSNPTN